MHSEQSTCPAGSNQPGIFNGVEIWCLTASFFLANGRFKNRNGRFCFPKSLSHYSGEKNIPVFYDVFRLPV